nr:hypothetical protein [Tanacetum cinerariifolium]
MIIATQIGNRGCTFERRRHRREATGRPRILWKNLKGEAIETFRTTVVERLMALEEVMSASGVEQMWNTLACVMKHVAKKSLGVANEMARTHSTHRESWWFCEEVQTKVTLKQSRFKELLSCRKGNQEDIGLVKERYKVSKREAKIAVANAKDKAYKDLYKKLDFKEGANDIYKIAKAQEKRRRDIGNVRYSKDEGGGTIVREEDIRKRWGEYLSSPFNENPFDKSRADVGRAVGSFSPYMHYECYYSRINQGKVKTALNKMGRNKAIGPDQIPIEAWRSLEDKGSTTEAIHLLRSLMKKYRERPRDLHMAFLDLEKAYDSAPRLHQGSTISLYLYTLILDELSRGIQEDIPWCMLFADDIVLIAESAKGLNNRLESWRKALENNGLRVSREKMKYLRCDFGSVLHRSGRIDDDDVAHHIRAGWTKSRAASGVLCDWRIPLKLKGKFYKDTIRPAMLYNSEYWSITKAQATRMEVAELRMLRWIRGDHGMPRLEELKPWKLKAQGEGVSGRFCFMFCLKIHDRKEYVMMGFKLVIMELLLDVKYEVTNLRNSYSCDEIVLDIFYNCCFIIYTFHYCGDALELKISKVNKLSYKQMCDLLVEKVNEDIWHWFYCKPNCCLEEGLTIVENDRDVKIMYEMANLHGHFEVYVAHFSQYLVANYYLKNLCVDEPDDDVTKQLLSHQNIYKEAKCFPSDLKGKSLLDDFDEEEGEGLGSLSSKRLSDDLKGKSLLNDFGIIKL